MIDVNSLGDDCCAPGDEPATCADGFKMVRMDTEMCEFSDAARFPGKNYRCCESPYKFGLTRN